MKFLSLIIATITLLAPTSANASSFLRICTATGNCRICDIVASAITIGQWLIAGAAGLALLVIVWAAFGIITSAGNAEKIGASKKQITGAIFGMVITMVSFQLISWIIFAFVVPSNISTPDPSNTTQVEKTADQANLKNLLGKAWWTICDEKDLREEDGAAEGFGSTANCKYWGDGTICEKFVAGDDTTETMNICFNGECIDPSNNDEKAKLDKYLKDMSKPKKDNINNACDFLSAVDSTYENYECATHDTSKDGVRECDTTKSIEKGFCPGGGTIVCCVKK